MLVSTLITAGVFIATFCPNSSIPSIHKKTQTPNFLHKPAFLAFSLAVTFALISASASILMFLSILISSYAEEECFKLLPKRLLIGMVAQIISITNMMVAFSAAFCMSYSHGSKWVQIFIFVISIVPLFLLFPLCWFDIIRSSYFCMPLFRRRK
ncbi:hypothetical protein GLYMA_09G054500v4 [Glycine max]|uniref:PGG domain-containing protein n=1 Tax=Glycine max TaxID=3847 RepID=K7LBX8_SOYBN|nr:hypothetical protein GYH30_024124 [Glycine max]KRH37255.1 hypothetical protein GLYMA_09G054500v4 [Glycine max]